MLVTAPGAGPTVKSVPVPASATVCGLPVALSVMVTVAARAPAAAGMKVTLMVQLAPAATGLVALHVVPAVVMAKSVAFAPAIVNPVIFSAALPVLLRVTVCAALVVVAI